MPINHSEVSYAMRTCILFIFTFFFGLTSFVFATQAPVSFPKVIVEASSLPEPTPLDSADITCITAKEIEQQQFVTLADALRRVPGVYVSQNGGMGQNAAISLRGAGTGQTAVILDGMHINDVSADNGAVNLAPWMIDDIAEIQIARGPLSSLYGSDAIGGAVILETKKGDGPFKAFAKGEAGSYSTYQQVLGVQGEEDHINYRITASRLQSAGSPLTPDRFRSLLQGKPDDPLHQEGVSARFRVGRDSAHLSFISRYLTRRLGYRVSLQPYRQNMAESFSRLQGHFEGLDGKWVHEVGIAYYANGRGDENPLGQKISENNGVQAQADWRQTMMINERTRLQIATELVQERFYTHNAGMPSTQKRLPHGGIGALLSMVIIDPLTVSTSVRIDKYQGIPLGSTYRFGAGYRFAGMSIKGGIGTGFKAPSLRQRFYQNPFQQGNPNLKPERSLGWDLGAERSFFQDRLTLGATLFQNRIWDLIAWEGNTHINRARARTQGIEGIAKLQITDGWGTELTHTYTQAWDVQTGLTLVRRPLYKTTFRVIGQITPEWQVSGNILYVGARYDNDSQSYLVPVRIKKPSYKVVGAETSYKLNGQWQIYGRGENLLNRRYEDPDGFQQPGFGVYAGVRAQW